MDQGTSAILGALIGASTGIMGGICLEIFKRGRDKRATALAIAASIDANIWMTEQRGHVRLFEALLPRLDQGELIPFSGFVDENHITDEIAQKYLDKIGLLDGDQGGRVVRFYTILHGIRLDLLKLTSGTFGSDTQSIAWIVRQDLNLWKEAESIGCALIRDIRSPANGYWMRAYRQASIVWLRFTNSFKR